MAKKKLHQWEPIGAKSEDISHVTDGIYRAINCRECVKCGLRKGGIQHRGFGTTAYYENGNILSTAILPFECINNERLDTAYQRKKNGKKPNKVDFLSEEEFYVR